MIFILGILFAALVVTDMVLTHRIIESGKGVEVGPVAQHYIHNRWLTALVTITATMLPLCMIWLTGFWWLLVLADLYMARLVWKNWRVLHG